MTTSMVSTFLLLALIFHCAKGAVFTIRNNCSYTVWAAAVPGGGQQLNSGQTWLLSVPALTTGGRIWARTNCNFDRSGQGKCQTGDCNGFLRCPNFGTPPNTMAEYILNQFNNLDFFDVSLVDGFNVPMAFKPNSGGCTRGISCATDINAQCPPELQVPGGCNGPCTVYKTYQYCCFGSTGSCGPTDLSRFFKTRCPDAYSYPTDDGNSMFTCPTKTNYEVVFCP